MIAQRHAHTLALPMWMVLALVLVGCGSQSIEKPTGLLMSGKPEYFKTRLLSQHQLDPPAAIPGMVLHWHERGEAGIPTPHAYVSSSGSLTISVKNWFASDSPDEATYYSGQLTPEQLDQLLSLLQSPQFISNARHYQGNLADYSIDLDVVLENASFTYACDGYFPQDIRKIAHVLNSVPLNRRPAPQSTALPKADTNPPVVNFP